MALWFQFEVVEEEEHIGSLQGEVLFSVDHAQEFGLPASASSGQHCSGLKFFVDVWFQLEALEEGKHIEALKGEALCSGLVQMYLARQCGFP